MARRRLPGLERVLGTNALFSTAYGNVGSSIYYALGLVASYALGLSLDELKALLEAEEARAALRDEWHTADPGPERRREILDEALGHLDRQLDLVRGRRREIDRLEEELVARRRRVRARLKQL